jgi:hypothetical protein
MGIHFSGFELKANLDLCMNRMAHIVNSGHDDDAIRAADILSNICLSIIESGEHCDLEDDPDPDED